MSPNGWGSDIGTELSACKKASPSPLHSSHCCIWRKEDNSRASECLFCDALMDVHYQCPSWPPSHPPAFNSWLENSAFFWKSICPVGGLTKAFPHKRTIMTIPASEWWLLTSGLCLELVAAGTSRRRASCVLNFCDISSKTPTSRKSTLIAQEQALSLKKGIRIREWMKEHTHDSVWPYTYVQSR